MCRAKCCWWIVWLVLTGCVYTATARAQRYEPSGRLGITVRFDTDAAGVSRMVVTAVVPGSPGERMGIRTGDVVLSVNGVQMDGPAALRPMHRQVASGEPLSVAVLRNGKTITLGRGSPADDRSALTPPPPVWLGVRLGECAPEWGIKGAVVGGSPRLSCRLCRLCCRGSHRADRRDIRRPTRRHSADDAPEIARSGLRGTRATR